MSDFDDIRKNLAQRWQARSPKSIANQFSEPLFGGAGEWDLPTGVTPTRELLYLAIGLPDAASLPKEALNEASHITYSKQGTWH